MKRLPPSLHARALVWLGQREHSRAELRSKLLRAARAAQRHERAGADGAAARVPGADVAINDAAAPEDDETEYDETEAAIAARVERLLDALQAEGLLSEQRFVESRVRVRAAGHGARRIEHELARHGLKLPAAQQQALRDSELQRAAALWRRRFGSAASDERERARQARFLAGRGFSGEVIRRVLARAGALPDDDAVDPA